MTKKTVLAIIGYRDFLNLNAEKRIALMQNEKAEFLIAVKKDEYKNLSDEEKAKLYGFRRTETEPLKKPEVDVEKLFVLDVERKDYLKPIVNISYKQKHLKKVHPYAPRTLVNKHFNSKKKGGRGN